MSNIKKVLTTVTIHQKELATELAATETELIRLLTSVKHQIQTLRKKADDLIALASANNNLAKEYIKKADELQAKLQELN